MTGLNVSARQGGESRLRSAEKPVLRPLADRDFLLFWLGQVVSKVGNSVYQVGLAWTVYQLTGSSAAMGLILALSTVPQLGLVLLGGTLADRLPRRTMIVVADGAAVLVTACLAVTAMEHDLSVTVLAIAAVLLGTANAFYGPAYSAINRDLLASEHLASGNSMVSIGSDVARTVGPVLAGAIFAIDGAASVFGFDAATFAMAVIAMLFTRVPSTRSARSERVGSGLLRETAAGLRYMAKSRELLLILAISLVANFACLAPYFVLLPEMVRAHHGSIGMLGLLSSCQTIACIVGAAVAGKVLPKVRPGSAMLTLAGTVGAGILLLGLGSSASLALFVGAALVGVGMAGDVIEHTLLQKVAEPGFLSRVYSINILISYSMTPLGFILAGVLARSAGSAVVFTGGGAILITVCAAAATLPVVKDLDIQAAAR